MQTDTGIKTWIENKWDRENRVTHNAERVGNDEALYYVFDAIDKACFDGDLLRLYGFRLYYIPNDMERENLRGVFVDKFIMISKPFYKAHRVDDDLLDCMFHEMLHAFCDSKHIKDSDGTVHLQTFADACVEHGGVCQWIDARVGYNYARLTDERRNRVKKQLARTVYGIA